MNASQPPEDRAVPTAAAAAPPNPWLIFLVSYAVLQALMIVLWPTLFAPCR